jgi:hypothetical protein
LVVVVVVVVVEVVLVIGVVVIGSQGEEVAGVVGSQIEEMALVALKVATMGTSGEFFSICPRSPWTQQSLQLLQAEEFLTTKKL